MCSKWNVNTLKYHLRQLVALDSTGDQGICVLEEQTGGGATLETATGAETGIAPDRHNDQAVQLFDAEGDLTEYIAITGLPKNQALLI